MVLRVEHAQADHHAEVAADRFVDVGFGEIVLLEGFLDRFLVAVEELGDAHLHRPGRALGEGGVVLVGGDQQAQRAAVGADDAILAPLLDRDVLEHRVHGAGDAVDAVVGGHVRPRAAFHHAHAEGKRVVLVEQAGVEIGGGVVASVLVAVGAEVLHQRGGLPVARMIALQALDEGDGHGAVEPGILAVALFGAAPADIAADVGVGRAHDQAAAVILGALVAVADFLGLDLGDLFHRSGVPSFAEADRLAEGGGGDGCWPAPVARAAEGQAVEAFNVLDAVEAEARDPCAGAGAQKLDLLIQRHPADQVVDALFDREVGVEVGVFVLAT